MGGLAAVGGVAEITGVAGIYGVEAAVENMGVLVNVVELAVVVALDEAVLIGIDLGRMFDGIDGDIAGAIDDGPVKDAGSGREGSIIAGSSVTSQLSNQILNGQLTIIRLFMSVLVRFIQNFPSG